MSNDYRKKSIKEKEFANRQHGLPNRCPECDLAVPPEEVPKHIAERCEGRPAPHPNSRWLSHKQALAMGVGKKELSELSSADIIRTKGETGKKRYLLRDISKFLSVKRTNAITAKAKREAKELTKKSKATKNKGMIEKKDLQNRVIAYIEQAGSVAQASRALDIPANTLQRAANGEKIRKGTQMMIEGSLDSAGK